MRIIPSSAGLFNNSSAEKKIYNLLSKIHLFDTQAVCFHSLRLSKHPYKRNGEIDFLVVTHSGIYVLEVKGGRISRKDNGIWQYTDRFGETHLSSEGPFRQAESAMYALLTLMREHFGGSHPICEMATGSGVVFPDSRFNLASPEWSSEMILDQSKLTSLDLFQKHLRKLVTYWDSKFSHREQLSGNDFDKLLGFLRPKFDLVRSLASEARDIEERMLEMTAQQYLIYDGAESNARIICDGGAGTGKTLVAADVARRHSENGRSVFFLVKNPLLAAYIKNNVPPEVHINTSADVTIDEPYDVLIIDEAQDLMNFEELGRVDQLLKGGLENGVWRIFMDKNNQLGVLGNFDPAALEMLELYHPSRMALNRNCRNTQTIIEQIRMMTAADVGTPTTGKGPLVQYKYAANPDDEVKILKDMLISLLRNDVLPGDITVLSKLSFDLSAASRLPGDLKNRISVITPADPGKYPSQFISFCNTPDFKGLENRFIIITDLDAASFESWGKTLIYVAMTRAKAGLSLIMAQEAKEVISELTISNFKKYY